MPPLSRSIIGFEDRGRHQSGTHFHAAEFHGAERGARRERRLVTGRTKANARASEAKNGESAPKWMEWSLSPVARSRGADRGGRVVRLGAGAAGRVQGSGAEQDRRLLGQPPRADVADTSSWSAGTARAAGLDGHEVADGAGRERRRGTTIGRGE